jgi:hypothetical protein
MIGAVLNSLVALTLHWIPMALSILLRVLVYGVQYVCGLTPPTKPWRVGSLLISPATHTPS